MAVKRNQRVYPLQLKNATDYPINLGLVAAYDYAGDPNNAYAGGNGTPHVGTQVLTRATVPPIVSLNGGEILARDTSNGKTEIIPYTGLSVGKLGFTTADGKGNFTIHRRYRAPSAYSGTSSNRVIAQYRSATNRVSICLTESISNPWCFIFVEMDSTSLSLPPSSTRFVNAAFRIPYSSIFDIHIVRAGDTAKLYLNGVEISSIAIPDFVLPNTNWAGMPEGVPDGNNLGNPTDLLLIDANYWNRDLSAGHITQHVNDPYAGYVNTAAVVVTTKPAKITNVIATGSQNALSVNGTVNSDGGAVIGSYEAKVYSSTNNSLLATLSAASLPISFTNMAAGTVYAKLTATNINGTSDPSDSSNIATITAPQLPPEPEPVVRTPVKFDFSAVYTIYPTDGTPPSGITSVTVTPEVITLNGNAVRQFNAVVTGSAGFDPSVTWTATGGSINAFGTFTAPEAIFVEQRILVRATSVQDQNKWDESEVIVNALVVPEVTSVTISPLTVTLKGNVAQKFSAVVNGLITPSQEVTWTCTGGTISSFGDFVSPAATSFEQTMSVRATSVQDPTKWAEATVKVSATVVEAPAPVFRIRLGTELPNGSFQPLANLTGLKWAWYDQYSPDQFGDLIAQGSEGTTDSNGWMTNEIRGTTLKSGAYGAVLVTDIESEIDPSYSAFFGPAQVV